jgi:hypothetical protein
LHIKSFFFVWKLDIVILYLKEKVSLFYKNIIAVKDSN